MVEKREQNKVKEEETKEGKGKRQNRRRKSNLDFGGVERLQPLVVVVAVRGISGMRPSAVTRASKGGKQRMR